MKTRKQNQVFRGGQLSQVHLWKFSREFRVKKGREETLNIQTDTLHISMFESETVMNSFENSELDTKNGKILATDLSDSQCVYESLTLSSLQW